MNKNDLEYLYTSLEYMEFLKDKYKGTAFIVEFHNIDFIKKNMRFFNLICKIRKIEGIIVYCN